MGTSNQTRKQRRGRGKGIELPGLRKARARRGLTIQELKDRTGIAASTIVGLENLDRGAQGRTLRTLAEALDVETEDLVG